MIWIVTVRPRTATERIVVRRGRDGPGLNPELVHGAFDMQTVLVNGGDVIFIGIAQGDVVPGPDEVGAQRAADGTGPDDGQLHADPPELVGASSTRSPAWSDRWTAAIKRWIRSPA